MSQYDELMDLVITEDTIEEYKERRSLHEGFFRKIKEKKNIKEYNELKDQFKKDFKLNSKLIDMGFGVFDVIKSKSDFDKMIKSTGSSLSNSIKNFIIQTYVFALNYDNQISQSDLIKQISLNDKLDKQYKQNAVYMINNAGQMFPLSLGSESEFYNLSNKKVYSMDYKGRISTMTLKEKFYDENIFE